MPNLTISVTDASVVTYAAIPTIAFRLQVASGVPDQRLHSIVLRAQLQLEVTRRHYTADEEGRLRDLFGERSRWGQTLKPMLWTHATIVIPAFVGETAADLQVPCTFDFNVAATKYFHGLTDGEIPINFLFSGSMFYEDEVGQLQVAPIPWSSEARHRLLVSTWRDLMNHYYPNTAWLNLSREAFDRLYQFKVREGIPTWDGVIDRIVPASATVEESS